MTIPGTHALAIRAAQGLEEPIGRDRWYQGSCWLGCERHDVAVQWVGNAADNYGNADVFACLDCQIRWQRLIRQSQVQRDFEALVAH